MTDVLEKILADKAAHVAVRKKQQPLSALEAACRDTPPPRGFVRALREARSGPVGTGLIAEIKKASPSAGLIRPDFDPAAAARAYTEGGAACLSVLTDAPYFQGEDRFIAEVRAACPLPVLRKDFMIEPYQIAESRALGADCVLLILAALDDAMARDLEDAAIGLGLDVLIECHDATELDRALKLKSPLIGINNRNLKTLTVDLATTEGLIAQIPDDRLAVSESGIYGAADIVRLKAVGVHTFLIGESLMKQPDLAAATRALLIPA